MKKQKKKLGLRKLTITKLNNLEDIKGGLVTFAGNNSGIDCTPTLSTPPLICNETNRDCPQTDIDC